MDERRDPAPGAGSDGPNLIAPAPGELSDVQEARRVYVQHATVECARCRDIDRDRCSRGEQLWRSWNDACDDAYRQLADEG